MKILKTIRHNDFLFGPGDEAALAEAAEHELLCKMHERGLVHLDTYEAVESPRTDADDNPTADTEKESAPRADETKGESGAIDATDGAIALAEEHGVDLSTVEGTGLNGRIIIADVRALVE